MVDGQRKSPDFNVFVRYLRLSLLLLVGWTTMVLTHEIGHILGGWLGGGSLRDYEIRPWRLPHSFFSPDPRPLLTLWAGPVLGVVFPCMFAFVLGRVLKFSQLDWVWFVANFCLLANGVYLAAAWVSGDHLLDTSRLLQAGSPPLVIGLYIFLTCSLGYVRFRNSCVRVLSPVLDAVS